jgi:hypothetical protein
MLIPTNSVVVCLTCKKSLLKKIIPTMSTFNRFKYPEVSPDLPPLDSITEIL